MSLLAFLLIGRMSKADVADRQTSAGSYAGEEAPAVKLAYQFRR